jgi:hypothetical protein
MMACVRVIDSWLKNIIQHVRCLLQQPYDVLLARILTHIFAIHFLSVWGRKAESRSTGITVIDGTGRWLIAVFPILFLLANPFYLSKIATESHILTHIIVMFR